MDELTNPYSPGAGVRPSALVGRDAELQSWGVALARLEARRPARSTALHGLRGVGKTVLLREFEREADRRGWITAMVEAGAAPLREALGRALRPSVVDLARPSSGERVLRAVKTFTSFTVSVDPAGAWSFGLDLDGAAGGGADTGELEADLAQLVRDLVAARDDGCGVVLLVDEAQDLPGADISALCALAHQASQRDWPLLLGLAGLPNLPRVLAEARSYAERLFAYRQVQQLSAEASREALVLPAAIEDVRWDGDALDHVVDRAGGYPYFLQEFGQATWDFAQGPDLTLADARAGAALGQAHLDAGFYRSRWERATPAQREYLQAMAADGEGPSESGQVAGRLGRTATGLGPIRDGLIKKGLIYAPQHGQVAFTVPGMASFISRLVT